VAILEGLVGDELEREGSDLVEPLSIRVDGEVVPPRTPELVAAFPVRTGRIVVFLHGLMETELSWGRGPEPRSYGERLQDELGWTPVYIRYNSGRRISRNGRSLADQLALLVDAWPAEVERIALVGHSMGGLVSRSACHQAALEGADWVRHVKHIVSLGTPHFGAPLEQVVHRASHVLSRVPETEPIARFLRRRSGGIRDLNQGSLVDEDWMGRDPDELRLAACQEVPLLEGATHCFVSATLTRNPNHPVARVIGDWLVLSDSASGRGRTRSLGFRDEDGLAVPGASHFALLNHPAVYRKLREWLSVPDSAR
jgi:pimeloyl-ACP methyl ester carboxylesterase